MKTVRSNTLFDEKFIPVRQLRRGDRGPKGQEEEEELGPRSVDASGPGREGGVGPRSVDSRSRDMGGGGGGPKRGPDGPTRLKTPLNGNGGPDWRACNAAHSCIFWVRANLHVLDTIINFYFPTLGFETWKNTHVCAKIHILISATLGPL